MGVPVIPQVRFRSRYSAASFISAIETVLAQIGVSASSDSSDTGSSSDEDVQENLDAFMKSLLEAMRPKDGSGAVRVFIRYRRAGRKPAPPPPLSSLQEALHLRHLTPNLKTM